MMVRVTSSPFAGRCPLLIQWSGVALVLLTLLCAPAGAQDLIDVPPSLPDVTVYHTSDVAGVDLREVAPAGCDLGTAGLITNSDFDSGFDDWNIVNTGLGGWSVETGTTTPESGSTTAGPYSGGNYAVSDQTGPGTHVLTQSFNVAPDPSSVVLRFAMFVNNFAISTNLGVLDHTTEDTVQFARVDIMTQADFDLRPFTVFPNDIELNIYAGSDIGTGVNGYTNYEVDITSIVEEGGDFVVRFAEADQIGTFNMGVDSVSIELNGDFCVIQGGPNEELEIWIDGGSVPTDTGEGEEIGDVICKLGDDGGAGAELCGAQLLLSLSGPGAMTHFEVAAGMNVLVHNPECAGEDETEYSCPLPPGTKLLSMNFRIGTGAPPVGPRKLGTLVLDTTGLMPGDETALSAYGASAGANLQLRPIASAEQPELIAAFPKPVPEPGAVVMLAFGVVALRVLDRRRSRRRTASETREPNAP